MTEPEVEPVPPAASADIAKAPPNDAEWRGNDGTHRRFAIGCAAVVVLLVLGFWVLRAVILR